MSRLRVNNCGDLTGSTNPLSVTTGGAVSWTSAPTNLPTVAAPDVIAICVKPGTSTEQIILITAFTAGATSATCSTTLEGGGALVAATSVAWGVMPTVVDFKNANTRGFARAWFK